MTSTAIKLNRTIEDLTLSITQEIHVRASLQVTFDSLLEYLGPLNETPDGKPMSLKLEAMAGRALVSRPGRRERPSVGACAGDQAAHAAWSSTGRCSCRIPSARTCNTG